MAGKYSPRAGNMTETLLFRRAVQVNDETADYVDAFTVCGAVDFNAGRDYQQSGAEVLETDVIFVIYSRSDVDPSMLIVHNGVKYRIRRLPPVTSGPRSLEMDILGRAVR